MKKFSTELFNGVDAFVFFPFSFAYVAPFIHSVASTSESLPKCGATCAARAHAPAGECCTTRTPANSLSARKIRQSSFAWPTGPMEAIAICARPSVLTYVRGLFRVAHRRAK